MTNAIPIPNPDYSNRNYQSPTDSKDLVNSIPHAEASISPPPPEPPISRHVTLPEKVSVKFLAEISEQPRYAITTLMNQLGVRVDRSVAFEDAAEILRRYGIAAEKVN